MEDNSASHEVCCPDRRRQKPQPPFTSSSDMFQWRKIPLLGHRKSLTRERIGRITVNSYDSCDAAQRRSRWKIDFSQYAVL